MKEKRPSFFSEVKQEYKNVSWPSKDQVISSTGVVIFFVIVISIFLGLIDLGIIKLIDFIIGL
ncbi:MAG TPA: preprotein translocase subunit SecE [Spirochaetota bacterium]|nr:preprotein translocase subunit SecE [Spirochaetota bacterium]HOM38355.1 preprotein translocase subunit SecE [Spirochaetota bacterium]HPQ48427.1 preprotein translocase subunit SecE [Spirochaetota bacterium]